MGLKSWYRKGKKLWKKISPYVELVMAFVPGGSAAFMATKLQKGYKFFNVGQKTLRSYSRARKYYDIYNAARQRAGKTRAV